MTLTQVFVIQVYLVLDRHQEPTVKNTMKVTCHMWLWLWPSMQTHLSQNCGSNLLIVWKDMIALTFIQFENDSRVNFTINLQIIWIQQQDYGVLQQIVSWNLEPLGRHSLEHCQPYHSEWQIPAPSLSQPVKRSANKRCLVNLATSIYQTICPQISFRAFSDKILVY